MRSLQDLSAFKVAAALWDGDITLKVPSRMYKVVDSVRNRLSKLQIPSTSRDRVFEFLEPIGQEIIMWRWVHLELNKILRNDFSSKEFVWTGNGTIDEPRTAELIIRTKKEETASCYQLACINCLESQIPKLWEQLEESRKSEMLKSHLSLVSYWSHVVAEKNMDEFLRKHNPHYRNSPNAFAFKRAADFNSQGAIKFFFQKLKLDEKEDVIIRTIKNSSPITDGDYTFYNNLHHAFCFLYPLLTEDQKEEVDAFSVLHSFMKWPYISKFMDFAKVLVLSLHQSEYNVILKNVTYEYFTCNYLFERFWNVSPMRLRQKIAFDELNKNNLRFIFKDKRKGKRWIVSQMSDLEDEFFSKDYLQLIGFVLSCCCSAKDVAEIKEDSINLLRKTHSDNSEVQKKLENYFDERIKK